MADQDGRHSEKITQLLRHVTSSPDDADVKEDIIRHAIYPRSLVVIDRIFSEIKIGGWRNPSPPRSQKAKKSRSKQGNVDEGNLTYEESSPVHRSTFVI